MDYLVIDTPARPESDDLKTLAEGCDSINFADHAGRCES